MIRSPQFPISQKVKNLKPSGIRKFFDLASSMKGVISLGVGEPDFVTSWGIREASILSLELGFTSYTANAGLIELRREISTYLSRHSQVQYDPISEILITVGASQALDLALRALLNPGDEVIIVEPCFVSYAPAVSLAGGTPVHISAHEDNQFKIQPEQIEEAVTERTKAMILCSPNNPTGTVLSRKELEALGEILKKHDLIAISDEIYGELTYDEPYCSFTEISGMMECTLLISGFSKGFAMTGWRLGYVAGPENILKEMLKIHQYTMMCAPTVAQYGAIEALKNGENDVTMMRKSYYRRRNYIVKALNELGLSCHLPGGAFYAFPSIQQSGLSSEQFAERLLIEEKVAVVPGHVFGDSGEGYIRCSYASSMDQLQEAIKRMGRFLQNL